MRVKDRFVLGILVLLALQLFTAACHQDSIPQFVMKPTTIQPRTNVAGEKSSAPPPSAVEISIPAAITSTSLPPLIGSEGGVIKDGKLVFEEYFQGQDLDLSNLESGGGYATKDFDRDTLHSTASVSKSITGILLGIAIDQGLVASTDETMFSYFPEYEHFNDPTKSHITLEHMLMMASGLPWTEAYAYDDLRNDWAGMLVSENPIAYVLSKSSVAEPGREFIYNSGTTNLLGEIIRRTSGMKFVDYAGQYLFTPLSIESYQWYSFPHMPEMAIASSTLYLRPRGMAKIGQLYLDGGVWNGKMVISEDWVSRSTRQAISMVESPLPNLNPAYGYLWGLGTFSTGDTETYFAVGHGGQFIFLLPEPHMVVVFTAGGFEERNYDALLQIVDEYILPAAGQ